MPFCFVVFVVFWGQTIDTLVCRVSEQFNKCYSPNKIKKILPNLLLGWGKAWAETGISETRKKWISSFQICIADKSMVNGSAWCQGTHLADRTQVWMHINSLSSSKCCFWTLSGDFVLHNEWKVKWLTTIPTLTAAIHSMLRTPPSLSKSCSKWSSNAHTIIQTYCRFFGFFKFINVHCII